MTKKQLQLVSEVHRAPEEPVPLTIGLPARLLNQVDEYAYTHAINREAAVCYLLATRLQGECVPAPVTMAVPSKPALRVVRGDFNTVSEIRWPRRAPEDMVQILGPMDLAHYWGNHIATEPGFDDNREQALLLTLNTKNRVTGHHIVSIGSLKESVLHPREVFRLAIMASANSIVLMHNHPSGDPVPSGHDSRITEKISKFGWELGIPLHDHVIIGHNCYCSFQENGAL